MVLLLVDLIVSSFDFLLDKKAGMHLTDYFYKSMPIVIYLLLVIVIH